MRNAMKFAVVSAFALLISLTAFAQSPEVSTLPVTEPLEVGGVILQPGTYMIRVLPSPADRNKVQITSPDRDKVYATLLTVPHALDPNEEVTNTTFVYFPAGEGMPRALRTWFAPNTSASFGGHDIVYEQTRAEQLARVSKSNVVSYTGTTQVADFDNTELHVITPEAKVETYTYVAPAPTPAPMISSERETTVQVADATPMEMPGTASNVPLIALLGLASLAGAFAVRMARN